MAHPNSTGSGTPRFASTLLRGGDTLLEPGAGINADAAVRGACATKGCLLALLLTALLLTSCGSYADFTLPPLTGGDPTLTFTLDQRPGPVLSDPGREALNPSVVAARKLLNFYSQFDGSAWHTAMATSADGIDWQRRGAILWPDPRTWEGSYIAANGSALIEGGKWWYWYQAGPKAHPRIGLLREGGARAPAPVLGYGPYMSWDERAVADPNVIRIGSYFYLYYLGQDRAVPPRQRLGMARSRDGVRWEKLRTNPILSPGGAGAFDENGVGEPAVWQFHGFYWMLFTGRDRNERRRLGLARSTDGVRWRKLPRVFAGAEAWDSQVICDPSVIVNGEEIRVWFGGGDAAKPDEGLDGQIGYGTLRPVHATLAP
ncbi:MAG: hypothetical protein ACLQVN_25490 [Bryobacteraceae bacterium]